MQWATRLVWLVMACGSIMAFVTVTSAEIITHGSTSISMDFVTIGNPGNAGDTRIMVDGTTGYGAVPYVYRIGKYEVSASQWVSVVSADLNDLLSNLGTWSENQPIANVSWYQAAMFCNWLTSGDTMLGAYTFTTLNNVPIGVLIDRESSRNTYGTTYVLPTEDEWHKAAFYDASATIYYDYPTGSNTMPTPVLGGTAPNTAVFNWGDQAVPADVNNAGGLSPYGTMGQGGNVWEKTETAADPAFPNYARIVLGGSYEDGWGAPLASYRGWRDTYDEYYTIGFRVASIDAVPEPSTLVDFIVVAAVGLMGYGWRLWRRKP